MILITPHLTESARPMGSFSAAHGYGRMRHEQVNNGPNHQLGHSTRGFLVYRSSVVYYIYFASAQRQAEHRKSMNFVNHFFFFSFFRCVQNSSFIFLSSWNHCTFGPQFIYVRSFSPLFLRNTRSPVSVGWTALGTSFISMLKCSALPAFYSSDRKKKE